MHHSEAVGHEGARRSVRGGDEFGQLLRQRQALVVVLAGFARVEADVLQQQDVAVGESLGAGQRVGPDDISGQLDVTAELLAQRLRDGASENFGSGPSLGLPRWAVTTTFAPASDSAFSVGTEAMMRPGSVMLPSSSSGTFRSERTSTPRPETPSASRSSSVLTAIG